jgi:hypothetical protein
MWAPVIASESIRKRIAVAIRLGGVQFVVSAPGLASRFAGVSIVPGRIVFTRMWSPAYSVASASAKAITPAFAVM